MTDKAIENARARRTQINDEVDTLVARLEALKAEAAEIDRFITAWHTFAGIPEGTENVAPESVTEAQFRSTVRRILQRRAGPKNPTKEEVGDVVYQMAMSYMRPVKREEILKELDGRGMTIHGVDPDKALTTMLWRLKERFERIDKEGYWPVGVPRVVGVSPADLL